ncbi:hypothetical protein EDD11_001025 [Mortierella claussenii]|nr:hypothetical protein EDD11_001025 [Mortierella claussenii]
METSPTHIASPRERQLRNQAVSKLLQCPPEILKLIIAFVRCPLDLKHLTHVCTVFLRITVSRDWFAAYCRLYPSWSKGCHLEDEPDRKDGSSSWKRIVIKDTSLCRRLAAPLPALTPDSDPSSAMDIDTITTQTHTPAEAPASIVSQRHHAATNDARLRILLSEAQVFHSDPITTAAQWRRTASPVYHIDYPSNSIIAASMLVRPTVGNESSQNDRQLLFYSLPDLTNPIAACGSDFWTADMGFGQSWHHDLPPQQVVVAQVVDIRHYPETIVNGEMRVVVVVAFGENTRPNAQQGGEDTFVLDIWRLIKVVEIWIPSIVATTTAYPAATFANKDANPWFSYTPGSSTTPKVVQPRKGRVETIYPSRNENVLRGRISKLYTATVPKATASVQTQGGEVELETLDCIAIFGIQDSESSAAMVIKKVLFLEDRARSIASWSKKQISRGVSCMTLFPYHSKFERMLALFNKYGRGLIWDWVNEKQIAQLHMPSDGQSQKTRETRASVHTSAQAPAQPPVHAPVLASPSITETLSTAETEQASTTSTSSSFFSAASLTTSTIDSDNTTTTGLNTAAAEFIEHPNLYYWGVQVSWAVDVPIPPREDPKQRCSFRIVILADAAENEWGAKKEWASACWHVDSHQLGPSDKDLEPPPFVPPGERKARYTPSAPPTSALYAQSRRYQKETLGYCLPEQKEAYATEDGEPVLFIAYVIWNHFRIGLTSKMGISILDMEAGAEEKDRQWVVFLEDTEDNPLMDIATVADNLVITRRHSHLVWSFFG